MYRLSLIILLSGWDRLRVPIFTFSSWYRQAFSSLYLHSVQLRGVWMLGLFAILYRSFTGRRSVTAHCHHLRRLVSFFFSLSFSVFIREMIIIGNLYHGTDLVNFHICKFSLSLQSTQVVGRWRMWVSRAYLSVLVFPFKFVATCFLSSLHRCGSRRCYRCRLSFSRLCGLVSADFPSLLHASKDLRVVPCCSTLWFLALRHVKLSTASFFYFSLSSSP